MWNGDNLSFFAPWLTIAICVRIVEVISWLVLCLGEGRADTNSFMMMCQRRTVRYPQYLVYSEPLNNALCQSLSDNT